MADVIRIKRRTGGGAAGAPAGLKNAELAFNEMDANGGTLYYGRGDDGAGNATSVIPIAGPGAFAPISNPIFVGDPRAPTPSPGDNDTSIATTAFVTAAVAASTAGVSSWNGRTGTVTFQSSDITGVGGALLASPVFTGTPAGPTAPNGTNSTQLATTQYVLSTRLDQLVPPAADVSWNSHKITNLLDPTGAQDAATKAYVDATTQGLDAKASVRAATTANITLSGTQTIDGVTLSAGDRVLVKDQTTASENGIYIVAAGGWGRAGDTDTWNELVSAYVFVESGTVNADNGFVCTVDPGGTLGTTNVTWTQFSGAGQVGAGAGLTKTGSTLDVVGTANRIVANADSIDIAATYVGQASITTLGTITVGIWNGTAVDVAHGGTGATTLTGYVKGAGTAALTASATVPIADITGLGTMAAQNANAVAITGGTIDNVVLDGGVF